MAHKNHIHAFRKLFRLFNRRERLRVAGLFVLMLVNALAEMVGVGLVPAFIMVVASPEKVMGHHLAEPVIQWLNIQSSRELLVAGSIALIVFFIVKGLLLAVIQHVRLSFVQYKYKELSGKLFAKYMLAPYSFHLNRNSSVLLRNLLDETNIVVFSVFTAVLNIMLNTLTMAFIIALLLAAQPLFSLIALLGLGGLSFLIMHLAKKKTDYYGQEEMKQRGISYKVVNEGLAGLKDVRVLGREWNFLSRYKQSMKRIMKAQFYRQMLQVLQRPVFEAVTVTGVLGLALLLTAREQPVENIIALLSLFAAATYRLMPLFKQLLNQITTLRYHIFSVNPVYDDLTELKHVPDQPLGTEAEPMRFEKEIVFKDVDFAYPGREELVLKGINLSIQRGKAVALVGVSGAGKTTLVDTLLGLLDVKRGTITVDGSNMKGHARQWRRNTGYIPQFIFLADASLKRNVTLGLEEKQIDEQRFRKAVEAAQLTQVIERLPRKENTLLGERGIRLSGGERQRVGIARALYQNPQLLIMDEGTSSLDSITEKYITDAIQRLKGERTIVMIAHRISTVVNCDVIYLMDHGNIIAAGTYEELMNSSVKFREMAGKADRSTFDL
ncbi:MAG: ABC transporter ATP-binding protein [Bacteroidales bacterium]